MPLNIAAVSGNLARDPELRTTQSGMGVLSFTVAVNDRRKNAAGEWEDRPNFIDCTMFGARAESLSDILAKGMKVAVAGKLRQSTWEKDGQRRSKVEIVADDVELPPRGAHAPAGRAAAGVSDYGIADEDIPF